MLLDLDGELVGAIHNGGAMVWLPDTTLLLAVGDGGRSHLAQPTWSVLGKALRLNDDGSVPADNPFAAGLTGRSRYIYANGLRNPFTMAISPSTGQVLANDVGLGSWEEVNDILPGANYGWPLVVGELGLEQAPTAHREAIYQYDHGTGCAVVGAAFYEPDSLSFPSEYHGAYLFADYCQGFIRVLDPGRGEVIAELARGLPRPISLRVGRGGELYYLGRARGDGSIADNTSTREGSLWRIRYTGSGAPAVGRAPRDAVVPPGEDAVFDVVASGQPPLTFSWLRDGRRVDSLTGARVRLGDLSLADDGTRIRAIVANDDGADTSAAAVLHVTANRRPVVRIITPTPGATDRAGDELRPAGMIVDPDDGPIDQADYRWRVDFHHDDHVHPVTEWTGAPVIVPIPRFGEVSSNVYYRVGLSATDGQGLLGSAYVDVLPELVRLDFSSAPRGITLNADGYNAPTPFTLTSVSGLERTVSAPLTVRRGDTLYRFVGWADGVLAADRPYATTAGVSFRAEYRAEPVRAGTGLRGEYFASPDLAEARSRGARVDSAIDFDWALEAPRFTAGLPTDSFSVRWTGAVEAPFAGEYTFTIQVTDGARLSVGGNSIIDTWVPQIANFYSGTVLLDSARQVPLQLEYVEFGDEAVVRMFWRHALIPDEVVPAQYLYPAYTPPGDTSQVLPGEKVRGLTLRAASMQQGASGVIEYTLGLPSAEVGDVVRVDLALIDALGRCVAKDVTAADELLTRKILPVPPLSRGLYTLTARRGREVTSVRLFLGAR